MTRIVIIEGESLDSFYDQIVDYLEAKYHYYKYHYYPSCTPDMQMGSRTASEMGFHERMAADFEDGTPPGKIVV